jgi:hypothetical protein
MEKTLNAKQVVSSSLLVLGVILVLSGFIKALGFTAGGVITSVAAIAALLYAGGVWFGTTARVVSDAAPHAHPVVVFDRDQRIVSGGAAGQPVASTFPNIIRPEIERRCAAALSGTTARFACLLDGRTTVFDVLPVRTADGTVIYGILLTTESVPSALAAMA